MSIKEMLINHWGSLAKNGPLANLSEVQSLVRQIATYWKYYEYYHETVDVGESKLYKSICESIAHQEVLRNVEERFDLAQWHVF